MLNYFGFGPFQRRTNFHSILKVLKILKNFIFKVFYVVKCCKTLVKCAYLNGKTQKTAHFQVLQHSENSENQTFPAVVGE